MEKLFSKPKSSLQKRPPTKGKHQKEKKKLRPEERLKSSQFRLLNEFLYTNSSKIAVEYFQKRKDDFNVVRHHLTC